MTASEAGQVTDAGGARLCRPAGQHRLKHAFPTDYVNINWIGFAQRG